MPTNDERLRCDVHPERGAIAFTENVPPIAMCRECYADWISPAPFKPASENTRLRPREAHPEGHSPPLAGPDEPKPLTSAPFDQDPRHLRALPDAPDDSSLPDTEEIPPWVSYSDHTDRTHRHGDHGYMLPPKEGRAHFRQTPEGERTASFSDDIISPDGYVKVDALGGVHVIKNRSGEFADPDEIRASVFGHPMTRAEEVAWRKALAELRHDIEEALESNHRWTVGVAFVIGVIVGMLLAVVIS